MLFHIAIASFALILRGYAYVQQSASTTSISPRDLVNKGITALGGRTALESLQGVSSHCYQYRSTSLEESFVPEYADTFIAETGNQTISYDLSGKPEDIIQRIDRQYQISNYWYFGRQTLEPVEASIVTRSGQNGYSCYISGNEGVYSEPATPFGYVDPYFAYILLRDATRLSPKLLLLFSDAADNLTASTIVSDGTSYPAVTNPLVNITVAFNPDSYLPFIIRSYEDHHIYGRSASDFKLYNYSSVSEVQFPRRIKLYYNEVNLLIDQLYDSIEVNPSFTQDYFQGLPISEINSTVLQLPPSPAQASTEYGAAEVFENTQNLIWYGPYKGNLSRVTVTKPHPELPNLLHLSFDDAPGYSTTILDLEDAVMVTDAPPHQSKLVIQWIKENLNKTPTHLLVTHHHHDHNYGAPDYVAVGAKLVVPEDFTYYWSSIPGVQFATATEDQPFIHKTKSMQVRGVYPGARQVHAADWMYYTFTVSCPTNDSLMAVEVADAWSPVFVGYLFNQFAAVEYLKIAARHQMPKSNLVIPIHGIPSNASDLYQQTAFDYPDFGILDFLPGGPWC